MVSDTHGLHDKLTLPKGDFLLHAGDFSGRGELSSYVSLNRWFMQQLDKGKFKHIVCCVGNHDLSFEDHEDLARSCFDPSIHILINQSVTLEGLKFYGSPVTPEFFNWAFNVPRNSEAMKANWDRIPDDTDVLLTHGPPMGILDRNLENVPCGCEVLAKRVMEVKPKVHCFGHIHRGYGMLMKKGITFINASSCTEEYKCTNKPMTVTV
jgi:Icc-related predicted phosphoesterase